MKLSAVVAAARRRRCVRTENHRHRTSRLPRRQQTLRTLTIVGTNDLHGALERLPLLAGYIANVRAARLADGGGVLLVDAGDLFQGTLESNLTEGADVVRAYNQMGYAAAAIGNHEFDYGPIGAAATPQSPADDPRGALKARVGEAHFPFLVSNIHDAITGKRPDWPNLQSSRLIDVAGIHVGIVGASTSQTPYTTMSANFVGLTMVPTARAIADEAKSLRARGAQVVVVTAHLGGKCNDLDQPADISSCDRNEELFAVLDELPKGLVDVFVAGHTHAAVAHQIDGIAVIESYSSGRAFGRVDLHVTDTGVTEAKIHKPELVCPVDKDQNPAPVVDCKPGPYEGNEVVPDSAVQAIVDEALARASVRRSEKLRVTLTSAITKSYATESSEGDWFADLMLAARSDVDIALTNGGGLRANIPAGELTYGRLFEAMPFDNRFTIVELRGKQVRRLVTSNLEHGGSILSWAGLTVKARCKANALDVVIKIGGKALDDEATYKLATSDFLASGADGVIGRLKLPASSIKTTDVMIRDAMADVLRRSKGTIDPEQRYGTAHSRRIDIEGGRPITCGGKSGDPD